MSLHRRIAAAAAIAVAAVCLLFGPAAYLLTRARLMDEVRLELVRLAAPFLQPHGPSGRAAAPAAGRTQGGTPQTGGQLSPGGPVTADRDIDQNPSSCAIRMSAEGGEQALGGPSGYFESVCPDGRVIALSGGQPKLPVSPRTLRVARTLRGAYFYTTEVNDTHLQVYVTPDVYDRKAIQVAVPLTSTDSALHALLVTYALLVAGGVLLAGLIGAVIARSALAPIRRFTSQTEQVTSALEHPRRLEESGAMEIRRLAASFNQTLAALERSVEAQRHLIADASHELRTPIAALRSNIQIFLDAERLPAEEQAGLRDAIVAELDDLTQLVADVLELARGTARNEHVEELELDAIVREATERARRRSPGIDFQLELTPTVIENASERVGRAVANVIDNARKWSPEDGTVQITLRDGVLTVRDHGPGFREEDLAHVFERFYRSADARRMPGSGLGLAIVKQAAEAHGGFATVENAPDGGALVRVCFGTARVGERAPGVAGQADAYA